MNSTSPNKFSIIAPCIYLTYSLSDESFSTLRKCILCHIYLSPSRNRRLYLSVNLSAFILHYLHKQTTPFLTIPRTVPGLPHPHSRLVLPFRTSLPSPPPTPHSYTRDLSRLHLPLSRHLPLPIVLSHKYPQHPPSSPLPHSTHCFPPHRYNYILLIRRNRK